MWGTMHRYALALAFSLTIIACGDNLDGGGAPTVGDLAGMPVVPDE